MTADDRLARIAAALDEAEDLEAVQRVASAGARELVDADGASFVLREGDLCAYVEEDAIAPLWKGRRFPMSACISGWVMEHQRPVVVPDVLADDRVPHDIYRPTFVRSVAVVPVRPAAPVGAVAVYWAGRHVASDAEVELMSSLADCVARALDPPAGDSASANGHSPRPAH